MENLVQVNCLMFSTIGVKLKLQQLQTMAVTEQIIAKYYMPVVLLECIAIAANFQHKITQLCRVLGSILDYLIQLHTRVSMG